MPRSLQCGFSHEALRLDYNRLVLSQVRAANREGTITAETTDDVAFGATLVILEPWHVEQFHITRCFVVQQWAMEKSGLNGATQPQSTSTTQSLDWQGWVSCVLLLFGHRPGPVPSNMPEHFLFTCVVYQECLDLVLFSALCVLFWWDSSCAVLTPSGCSTVLSAALSAQGAGGQVRT